jgi:acetylornithine/LysW-gamma-L-lysine aminotransferase
MRQDVARALPHGWHDGGDAGNPVVCAAAAATIRLAADPTMQARGATAGDHLMRRLEGLRISEIRKVRGRGLLAAVELRHAATPVLRLLQERGVLAIAGGGGVIRFMPPLTIERRDIDIAVEALAWSIRTSRGSHRPAPPGSVSLRGVARRPAHAASS